MTTKFQVEVDSKALKERLSLICGIPGYTDHIVLLTAHSSGELAIEGASSGSYIKLTMPAKVTDPGEIFIDADYITSLQLKQDVKFEQDGAKINFKSGRLRGSLDLAQTCGVEAARPTKTVDTKVMLERSLLADALSRSDLVPSIPDPAHGIRLVISPTQFKAMTNDQHRGTLFTRDLLIQQKDSIDFLIKPAVLGSVISRIGDTQIAIGEDKGIFVLLSSSAEFYYPSIQQADPDDVEEFFNDLDHSACAGRIALNVSTFMDDVKSASSIVSVLGFDTKLHLAFKEKQVAIMVTSPHGEATASHELAVAVDGEFKVKLSSKYLLEMLALAGCKVVELNVWDDKISLESTDGYRSAMPVIVD